MLVRPTSRAGFTITEILVVIGAIIVLIGILLPALSTMRTQGAMAVSENNLRQVGVWMRSYSTENRELIVPSQFNYAGNPYPGHIRNEPAVILGAQNAGTWTDILWVLYVGQSFRQIAGEAGHDYSKDSPDLSFYAMLPNFEDNPLRSEALNTKIPPNGTGATPYGTGALDEERGMPGYFAANNFFNADSTSPTFNGWWVTGQVRSPDRSMYAVDSFYGETIEDEPVPFNNTDPTLIQVDFRYADACIMLFLDGSVRPVGVWEDLVNLETERRIRVTNLHQQQP